MKRPTLALLAITLALPALLGAAAVDAVFPDSDIGRRAAAYIAAFNTGREEAMRAFIEANVSQGSLAQRPVDARLVVYREMRDEHRTLTPVRLVRTDAAELQVIARTGHGASLDLTFLFEPEAPHTLLGLRVMDTGPGHGEPEATAATTPLPDDQAAAAWGVYLDSLAKAERFSGAVLLVKGDQVLFRSAYGLASRKDRVPARTDTKFNLGSINKIFTRLAIAQLVERGKVKLDDTIDRYLPDYPKSVASRVTVRQLLEHRGGVGDIFGATYDAADRTKLRTVGDWIPLFRDKPLAFEPGSQQEYSNGGYVLLGAIVEKASGEDYYDYVRRHIYGPLGMKDSDHFADDQRVPNRARGYTRHRDAGESFDAAGLAENSRSRPIRGSPAGGGYSTLDDLLAFTRAIRAGTLVSADLRRDFRDLGPGPGGEAGLGIGGGAPGINAAVEMSGPYTIIVLTNLDPPAAGSAAQQLRRWLPQGSPGGRRVAVPHRRPDGEAGARSSGGHSSDAGAGAHAAPAQAQAAAAPGGPVMRRMQAPQPPERSSIPAAGVDVEMSRSGHLPAVRVMVNGQGPFLFALDTGAAGSARLDSSLVTKLGLTTVGQVRGGDPSGRNARMMDVVRIESIEIGGARFEGMQAAVRGYNEGRIGEPVDGILGFALFQACLLTLDYPANRLRIERGELPPADGDKVLAFTSPRGIPSVRLRVDSLTIDADVDAGSMGGLSLPIALAKKLPLASPLRTVGKARTVANEFEIKGAELNGTVHLGGHEFARPMLDFQPIFPMANVGSRVLRDFRVTFDQKNGRMRLTRGA